MDKKVQIQKTVLDRAGFKDFIDNKFNFFKEPEPIVDPDTVEELFRLYDKLYMQIPIDTDEQSHKYLVEQSSELYQVDKQLESIQPLLDEVASLRGQLLEANRQILELEAKLAGGGQIDFADAEQLALVRTELAAAQNTITALETANTIANSATKEAQEQAKAAQESAKKAAETAATASTTTTGTTSNPVVDEIINSLYDKKGNLFHARRIMEDRKYYRRLTRRGAFRNTAISNRYQQRYYWLFEERPYGNSGTYKTYFIPNSLDEARIMTMDFLIEELRKGYTAEEIVSTIAQKGSFKNNISIRTRTFKDPDRETGILYQVK
jgi:multidrug efflux pump subunit AcrA (membrane-fusion protein)